MGKRLGQHFLKDEKVLVRIANAALSVNDREPAGNECVIEIGAGHGELTEVLLAAGAKKVIAIEKDSALAHELRKKCGSGGRLEIIEGDVREILPKLFENGKRKVGNSGCVITGNIPYYLTGYLFRLLGDIVINHPAFPISRIVLLVQKEVAERICAAPPRMNLLAATVQFWATPRIVALVPPGAFSPPPKVLSAVLTLTPFPISPDIAPPRYLAIARTLFAHPRKTAVNNLMGGFSLTRAHAESLVRTAGLERDARPAHFSVAHIKTIANIMYN